MAYCSKCGTKLNEGSRFCHCCGQSVADSMFTGNERKTVYEGDLRKCPNCGALLDAFSSRCISCGYELRNATNSNAVKKFVEKYELAETNKQKVGLIRTFAVPNTREDIMEFIILAASNIDFFDYFAEADEEGNLPGDLTDAWMAKFEQAFNKAQMLFQEGDRYLDQIREIGARLASNAEAYEVARKDRNKQLKKEQRRAEWKAKDKSTLTLLLISGGCFLLVILMFLFIWLFDSVIPNRKLEKLSEEVEELIEDGEYEAALRKANQLIYDGDWSDELEEKWNSIRESYLEEIGMAKAKKAGEASVPQGKFKGMNYKDVEKEFKKAGFTNIILEKVPDLVTGLINDDGEVIEVIVNGSKTYSAGDEFDPSVKVEIKYHTFK